MELYDCDGIKLDDLEITDILVTQLKCEDLLELFLGNDELQEILRMYVGVYFLKHTNKEDIYDNDLEAHIGKFFVDKWEVDLLQ